MSKHDPINTLGNKLDPNGKEERDAIHVAVIPVILSKEDDSWYSAGEKVKFLPGSTDTVRRVVDHDDKGDGVIDPFLSNLDYDNRPEPGDRVWMFLYPNTVTGMRHAWEWDKIDNPTEMSESESWIRDFADRWGFNYDELISVATNPKSTNIADSWDRDYVVAMGRDLHNVDELGEDHDLFWHHLGKITGKEYSKEHQALVGWSCSC